MVKPVIDIFYSFDDNFTKYVTVSLYSLICFWASQTVKII